MTGLVTIAGRRYAAGLFWQAAPTVAAAAREARLLARRAELAADLYCLRTGGSPQFGLGQRAAGHRPGMRAIAVLLANRVPAESWLGAFRTGDGWLYVAVRRGAILPDGDHLFTDEAAAQSRLGEDLAAGGWERIYLPAGWPLPADAPARADALLVELVADGKDGRLRPIVPRRLPGVAVAAAACLVAIAVQRLALHPAPPPRAEAVPAPALPWAEAPSAVLVLRTCIRLMRIVPLFPGFKPPQVTCAGHAVRALYRRGLGSLAWLPRESVSVESPDTAVSARPIPDPLPARPSGETPWPSERAKRWLWSAGQTHGIAVTLAPGTPAHRHEAQGPLPFVLLAAAISGPISPDHLIPLLAVIPALVIDEVQWDGKDWTAKGRLYVR